MLRICILFVSLGFPFHLFAQTPPFDNQNDGRYNTIPYVPAKSDGVMSTSVNTGRFSCWSMIFLFVKITPVMIIPEYQLEYYEKDFHNSLTWEPDFSVPVGKTRWLVVPSFYYNLIDYYGGGSLSLYYELNFSKKGFSNYLGAGYFADLNGHGPKINYRFFYGFDSLLASKGRDGVFIDFSYGRELKNGINRYGVKCGYDHIFDFR